MNLCARPETDLVYTVPNHSGEHLLDHGGFSPSSHQIELSEEQQGALFVRLGTEEQRCTGITEFQH
jgi:hypothetical protein